MPANILVVAQQPWCGVRVSQLAFSHVELPCRLVWHVEPSSPHLSKPTLSLLIIFPMDSPYKEWFDLVDTDKNGQLDCIELQKSLALSDLKFSLVTVGQLIRVHDRTNTGTISLEEFKDLHRFLKEAKKTFRRLDAGKKGFLTYDEVWTAVQSAGVNMDRKRAFQRMVVSFDPKRKCSLDLSEFIRLKLYIQCAISTFHAFDSNLTGKVTLNCSQFIFAAANVM